MTHDKIMSAKIRPSLEMPRMWPQNLPNKSNGQPQYVPQFYWEDLTISHTPLFFRKELQVSWNAAQKLIERGAMLAGGFMVDGYRGVMPKDMDLYFDSALTLKRVLIAARDMGYLITEAQLIELENGITNITLTHHDSEYIPINIINAEYRSNLRSTLQWFDLSICMIGVEVRPMIGFRI